MTSPIAPKPKKATKATKVQATTKPEPKVWTGKPIPDLSGYSAKKQVALLACWLGAAKYTDAAHAKYDAPLAAARAALAAEDAAIAKGKAAKAATASKPTKATKAKAAPSSANADASEAPELTEVTPPAPVGRRTGRKLDTKPAVQAELKAILE